ncbi:MAG: class I mannose-6-phosphate isomerase [Muribaculaceae bacterium]|nr:class I mannose-6-phosphate isomerase [Muribaculaceae bacterium]
MIKKEPIRFIPYLKSVIWGGEKICRYKGIEQTQADIGESWEISAVPGHESVVAEGPYKGMKLTELIDCFGSELLGNAVMQRYDGKFPLLVKLIDANDNLSVQVHPDDELAGKRHDSLGKTEMWYIIDADEDARIYSGLNREMTADEYVRRVNDDTIEEVLAVHESHPGDVFFLPAGRVHAIGAGNLLAEIQESSDITYRIYDYGRKDVSGKARELHTELAKDAIDYTFHEDYKSASPEDSIADAVVAECDHFKVSRILLDNEMTLRFDDRSFVVLMCLEGGAALDYEGGSMPVKAGETLLLPAALACVTLRGKGTLLTATA